jgi:NitT/TauT family transport system substrate-binding protein
MRKLIRWIIVAVVAICSSVAQTATAQDGTIVFTPQWTPQAQFAGYYVAQELGFYRDAGLNVTIEHHSVTH